jgi:hypothetical protein
VFRKAILDTFVESNIPTEIATRLQSKTQLGAEFEDMINAIFVAQIMIMSGHHAIEDTQIDINDESFHLSIYDFIKMFLKQVGIRIYHSPFLFSDSVTCDVRFENVNRVFEIILSAYSVTFQQLVPYPILLNEILSHPAVEYHSRVASYHTPYKSVGGTDNMGEETLFIKQPDIKYDNVARSVDTGNLIKRADQEINIDYNQYNGQNNMYSNHENPYKNAQNNRISNHSRSSRHLRQKAHAHTNNAHSSHSAHSIHSVNSTNNANSAHSGHSTRRTDRNSTSRRDNSRRTSQSYVDQDNSTTQSNTLDTNNINNKKQSSKMGYYGN